MKVKIGDIIYDGAEQPVMVILNSNDKRNIAEMPPYVAHYCEYPDECDSEAIKLWMKEI